MTKTWSCALTNSSTSSLKGKARMRSVFRCTPCFQGWRRRAIIDRAVSSLLDRVAPDGLRYQCLGGIEFAQEALHVVDIDDAFLAVLGHAVAARTAREVGALGRMGRGQRAIGDGVAIDIEIAPEQLAVLKLLRGDDLAAVI